jgi:signal transduction histidine kinase
MVRRVMGPEAAIDLARLFPGDSEMAGRMRAFDWSRTALGEPATWPQNLRVALGICLASRFPMHVWWGRSLTLFYNDAFISFLGPAKHPAVLGRSGREAWSEIWEMIGPMVERVFATGQASWSEDALMFFDRALPKEEVCVTCSFSPVLGEGNRVDGLFCACTETTETLLGNRRMDTLRKLAVQASVARAVDEACRAAIGVIASNPDDLPFAAIYRAEEGDSAWLVAAAGKATMGEWLPTTVAWDGEGDDRLSIRAAARGHRAVEIQGIEIHLEGAPWPEPIRSALAVPIRGAAHEPIAGVLIAGFSPRRPIDAAYRSFFELVASHVATAMAAARAYEDERRRADELATLDRAKTAFFSNVSHEFRTPLTLLLGPLEEEIRTNAGARERLMIVHRNALRLLKLVNTLLDFSRIEAGRIQAVYEPIDLAGLTAELASIFRSAIEISGLRLVVSCDPARDPTYVDREMWEKIVFNLLSNALKFTFKGSIEVRLGQRGKHVQLTVADTGVGIPAAELPRVFERFHRVRGARSRTHDGAGIGLALVQELVRLHHGDVRVQSVENGGTTFTVSIPTGRGHLRDEDIGAARTSPSTAMHGSLFAEEAALWARNDLLTSGGRETTGSREVKRDGARKRILLADDDGDMRNYVAGLLRAEGHDVHTYSDGAAALAAARERAPDLVLADVMMPALDGFELVAALRSDPALRAVPVLLLSARAGEEASVYGLRRGADDYIAKPFSARELCVRVRAHLDLGELRAAVAREREAIQAARVALIARLDLAQEDQRHHVARDLRDRIAQTVAAIGLLANAARNGGPLPAKAEESLSQIQRAAAELGTEVHAVAMRLRPTALDDLGLSAAVAHLVSSWSSEAKIEADFQDSLGSAARLARNVETTIYRLVQEALSNIERHAGARRANVTLARHAERIIVMVEDDGQGFDPSSVPEDRIGLPGMRERVAILGGTFSLESSPGRGTAVIARIPAEPAAS